jgi:hypothetical protein
VNAPGTTIVGSEVLHSQSGDAAVRAHRLSVDPAGVGADQERDDAGNLFRLAKSFQGRHLGKLLNLLFALPFRNKSVATGPGATALTVMFGRAAK